MFKNIRKLFSYIQTYKIFIKNQFFKYLLTSISSNATIIIEKVYVITSIKSKKPLSISTRFNPKNSTFEFTNIAELYMKHNTIQTIIG